VMMRKLVQKPVVSERDVEALQQYNRRARTPRANVNALSSIRDFPRHRVQGNLPMATAWPFLSEGAVVARKENATAGRKSIKNRLG
jgi:hypothetical protein